MKATVKYLCIAVILAIALTVAYVEYVRPHVFPDRCRTEQTALPE